MARTSRTKRDPVEGDRIIAVFNALVGKSKEKAEKLLRNPIDRLIFEGAFDLERTVVKERKKKKERRRRGRPSSGPRGGGGGRGF